jgi:hypothetical protein
MAGPGLFRPLSVAWSTPWGLSSEACLCCSPEGELVTVTGWRGSRRGRRAPQLSGYHQLVVPGKQEGEQSKTDEEQRPNSCTMIIVASS